MKRTDKMNNNYNSCSECIYNMGNDWCEKIGASHKDYLCDECCADNKYNVLSKHKRPNRLNRHKINEIFKEKHKKRCKYLNNYYYIDGNYSKPNSSCKYEKKLCQKKVRHYGLPFHKGNDYKKIEYVSSNSLKKTKTFAKDKKESKKLITAEDFIKFYHIKDKMVCDFIYLIEEHGFLKDAILEDDSYGYILPMLSKGIAIGIDCIYNDSYRIGIDPKDWFNKTYQCGICAYFPMSKRDYNNFINVVEKVLNDKRFRKNWDKHCEPLFKNDRKV